MDDDMDRFWALINLQLGIAHETRGITPEILEAAGDAFRACDKLIKLADALAKGE
jgi:hypothetical protein